MTIPFFIDDPIALKKVEVPQDILYYCDTFTVDADREDLRYIDCVWMHMGYYGVPHYVMKEVRNEFDPPPIKPIFD